VNLLPSSCLGFNALIICDLMLHINLLMYLNFKGKHGKTYQKSKGFPKASSNYNAKAKSNKVKVHIKYHEYYVIYKNLNLKSQKKMNSKYNTTKYMQNKMNNYVHCISLFSL
jgi:hypothetical protein